MLKDLKITQGEADDLRELVEELEGLEGQAGRDAARVIGLLKRVLKHAPPPDPFGFSLDEEASCSARS